MGGEGFAFSAIESIKNNRNLINKRKHFDTDQHIDTYAKVEIKKQKPLSNFQRQRIKFEIQDQKRKNLIITIFVFGVVFMVTIAFAIWFGPYLRSFLIG